MCSKLIKFHFISSLTHRKVSCDRRQRPSKASVNRVKSINFAPTWRDLQEFGPLFQLPHRKY